MVLFRPFDSIVLVGILLASIFAVVQFRGEAGTKAEVKVESEKVASFRLAGKEKTVFIETRIGKVELKVGKGSIQVLSSPCDHKICILQGAIQHTHEHIICLPARMYISITHGDDNPFDQIDAISY